MKNYLNKDILNCIFDKNKVFAQKTDGLSTGLGLFLSNSLLELNGGKIIFDSLPDNIIMFGFTIGLTEKKTTINHKKSSISF